MRHVVMMVLQVAYTVGAFAVIAAGLLSYTVVVLSSLLFPTSFASISATATVSSVPEVRVGAKWYSPTSSWINNLTLNLDNDGVGGFYFNGSAPPYNDDESISWCNMPHVHVSNYQVPSSAFELVYVEVIHRHHKRTPYQDNGFPIETSAWSCSDIGLFIYGASLGTVANSSAGVYWQVEENPVNPYHISGLKGTCQFPQITMGGLDDSRKHGDDLFGVYGSKLRFLPEHPDETVAFRVTNNIITSQVAGALIKGMFGPALLEEVPLSIQPALTDSLEPKYSCPPASQLYRSYSVGSLDPAWLFHLNESRSLFQALDIVSGVPESDFEFHKSFDHYFDNLSARQCHQQPLPCSVRDTSRCVTQKQADSVYRIGMYEYSYIHRDSPRSLDAALGSYGVFVAELVHNIRAKISGQSKIKYLHNIAHDGSISRLLSLLQVEKMIWPGMGAELVFEVYKRKDKDNHVVRVLWGGRVFESSHPALGKIDMIDIDIFTGYLEELVGKQVEKVVAFCTNDVNGS
ncbi:hypothetical protein H072_5879 [Dactylellina haptotyla CBS 200.50]|uniref:Uncharacterized protein n=1 Tax=Dactylellina haptotyla (strain CBS 200.50) TaxID=1284197 RepID=S8ABJ4_DACHA|nr:hypothetical protein H072_5879 [Dactylellina haptotyla CBS 200.50]